MGCAGRHSGARYSVSEVKLHMTRSVPPRLKRESGAWSYAKKWLAPAVIIALICAVAGGVLVVANKADASDVEVKVQRVTQEHRNDYYRTDERIDTLEVGEATQTQILKRMKTQLDDMEKKIDQLGKRRR